MVFSSSEVAAWVQAAGSILALVVAIAVPLRMSKLDRLRLSAERSVRIKAYAYAMLPAIERLMADVHILESNLRREKSYLNFDTFAERLRDSVTRIDRPIELHELGTISHPILDSMAALEEVASLLEEHFEHAKHGGQRIDPETGDCYPLADPPPFEPTLAHAKDKLAAGIHKLRGLFQ